MLAATFRIKDPEEKLKVLEELVGAGLKDKLLLLSKHVVRARVYVRAQCCSRRHVHACLCHRQLACE